MGELTKKIKIVAVNASESAIEKINNAKSTFSTILEEIKLNPTAKGVKILK
jgi:ribosomal protein L18E